LIDLPVAAHDQNSADDNYRQQYVDKNELLVFRFDRRLFFGILILLFQLLGGRPLFFLALTLLADVIFIQMEISRIDIAQSLVSQVSQAVILGRMVLGALGRGR